MNQQHRLHNDNNYIGEDIDDNDVVVDVDDDEDDSTACSGSRKSTSTDGPSSGRVPVIDTREGITVESIITYFIIK